MAAAAAPARVVSDPRAATHDKVVSAQEYYDGELDAQRLMHGDGTYVWGDRTNWHGKAAIVYSGEQRAAAPSRGVARTRLH